MDINYIWAAIIIAVIILLVLANVAWTRVTASKNNVIRRLTAQKNWQWVNPDNGMGIPYVFDLSSVPSGQIQISYYDDGGYTTGFNTFVVQYSELTANIINCTYVSVIKNYTEIMPKFPWTITWVDDYNLVFSVPGSPARMLTPL